jgi:hypothetical protein
MSVLLAVDQVDLYPPDTSAQDSHGWVDPGPAPPTWTGLGSLQLTAGVSDPRAAEGGGFGPFSPGAVELGTLYLPPEASPVEGTVAVVRSRMFVLGKVRLVPDPTGSGMLDCWAAAASGNEAWAVSDA